jgi:hypothetical protein
MHVRYLTGWALRAAVPYSNQNACTAIVNILIKNKKQKHLTAPMHFNAFELKRACISTPMEYVYLQYGIL